MPGGQLKRPGPPLGEQSVIQHTPPPSLHPPSRQAPEDFPGPSKRRKSSDQVGDAAMAPLSPRRRTFFFLKSALLIRYCVSSFAQASHPGLQRFSGQSLTQHHSSGHPLPPKPAFWNPIHKNNSPPWQPDASERRNPSTQEFQVRIVRMFF